MAKTYINQLKNQEQYNLVTQNLYTYSGPNDTCKGFPTGKLGNMASVFPHTLLNYTWKGTEFLYLCGEWSRNTEQDRVIQEDILTATSGYAAKRYKKGKYKKKCPRRPDFESFRYDWMLWCVWQKCRLNQEFADLLISLPDEATVVEVAKNDTVWAVWPDEVTGKLCGGNAMGKILNICRDCLKHNTHPDIDLDYLNDTGIYILGKRVDFKGIPL